MDLRISELLEEILSKINHIYMIYNLQYYETWKAEKLINYENSTNQIFVIHRNYITKYTTTFYIQSLHELIYHFDCERYIWFGYCKVL